MASKKELLDEIAQLQATTATQATEIRANHARERERQRREHRAQQVKRRAAEQKERRDRINDLAAGKLDLKGATDWGIVSEDGVTGIQVFVPLDAEEQQVAYGYLRRKGKPEIKGTADWIDELREQLHLAWPVHAPFSGPFASHPVVI